MDQLDKKYPSIKQKMGRQREIMNMIFDMETKLEKLNEKIGDLKDEYHMLDVFINMEKDYFCLNDNKQS